MQGQNFIRAFFFIVFFSVGAAAVGCSIICDDLVKYYKNKDLLDKEKRRTARHEVLDDDYQALLHKLEDDPNVLAHLARATIGVENNDPDTAYPKATAQQLAEAKKTLAAAAGTEPNAPPVPAYLIRCSQPRLRISLFCCGCALVILSFICFGPAKPPPEEGL